MAKMKPVFDIHDIDLTPEEIKQCGIIHTAGGVIRLMPSSVIRKIEAAKARAILSMRWEKDE